MDPNAPSSGDHAAASPTNTTVTLPPLNLRDVPRLPAAAAIPNPISRHPYFHPPATPSCGGFMPSQSTNAPESGSSGLSKVRLVGRMLNKVERVTDVAFTLDDGTGRIDVNRWENESSDTKKMSDVKDGDYVIVNGGLKGFQGKRHVVAYSMRS